MKNPEADLVDVLGEWFRGQNLRTFFEVEPFAYASRFDLVAMNDEELHVVEAKMGWTAGLRRQAWKASYFADRTWAAIRRTAPGFPSKPKLTGYGLLVVRPDDSIEIAWEPEPIHQWRSEEAVRQAITPFHEIQRGGVPGFVPGEKVLNFFRSRELTVHRRLWILNLHDPRPRQVGEILDVCGDLFAMYRAPRATLQKVLSRKSFSKELRNGHKRQAYTPTGLGMPPGACPKTAPLDEVWSRPGTISLDA